MKKFGLFTILVCACLFMMGQIIIPINKKRIESYGIWQYDNLIIDTLHTRLDAKFIATDTASIWGDYSEKLLIDDFVYECIYESLPLVPSDTTFLPGDTLQYTETFLPVFDRHNSGKMLSFIGSDSIDFCVKLPTMDWDHEIVELHQSLVESALTAYNEDDLVASARNLRLAFELRNQPDKLLIDDLVASICFKSYDLNIRPRNIIAQDLYKYLELLNNPKFRDQWACFDFILSTLNLSDSCGVIRSREISTRIIDSLNTVELSNDSIASKLFHHRGTSNLYLNNINEAIIDFKNAILFQEKTNGINNQWLNLNRELAYCYAIQEQYRECLNVDLNCLRQAKGFSSEQLSLLYRDISNDYLNTHDYDNFILYAIKSISEQECPDEIKYELYYYLGVVYYQEKNDMDMAEKYFDLWADISIGFKSVPENFKTYINKREMLSAFYINIRNYPKAISNSYHNISEISEILGTECWEYAQSINNMANALSGIGEKEQSLKLSQASFDLRCKIHDQDSTLVPKSALVRSSINLSDFYRQHRDYENAKKYALFAIANTDSTQDLRVQALLKSAYIDFETENKDAGFDKFIEARKTLSILENEHGEENYYNDELNTLAVMASFAFDYGAYKDVKKYYDEYKKIILKYNLPNKYLLDYYAAILRSSYFDNKNKLVIKSGTEFLKLARKLVSDAFIRLDGRQRHNFMNDLIPVINEVCCYIAMTRDKKAGAILYDLMLLRKGILLQADQDFNDFILASNNQQLISLRDRYNANNKLINSRSGEINVDSLSLENESIEHNLLRLSSSIGDFTNGMLVSYKDVKDKLVDNDVAIEFLKIDYQNEDNENEVMYFALLLSQNNKYPQIVDINFTNKDYDDESNNDVAVLYDKIWKPLLPYLTKTHNIYVCCDGVLHNIGIEYLTNTEGKSIGENYNIYRLSSTRQLVKGKALNMGTSIGLYGGLNYEIATNCNEDISISSQIMNTTVKDELRSFRDVRYGVRYLPYTSVEIANIDSIIQSISTYPTIIFTGSHGTEESVKELDFTKFRILHFATHGFFWNQDIANKRQYISFLSESNNSDQIDNALNRSGILMSGANVSLRGDNSLSNQEDGILTAREISLLDLKKVDLIVLSACQTGLGDTTDEGVFGLQRGFKLAGANTLLMSLWKVDDNATQLLMTSFYKNYRGSGVVPWQG